MNYNKFSKTSMYIFISPKISKSIFVEPGGGGGGGGGGWPYYD